MTFRELKLSQPVLRAVQEAGYETPSPIQARAIPPVLSGRDLMGCAQTGTGKTAAFALPMLDRLTAKPPRQKGAVRALILTPTRELALQIGESFDAYGKYLPLRSTVIFGGVGQAPQVEALRRGVDILVACPGRLNDLIGQGLVDLRFIEIFVLDEADRMLDMGFVHDVKKVIAKLPPKRQNLMFSATMPAEIEQLAGSILREPAFVKVDPVSSTVERIDQSLYFVQKADKRRLLPWLIQNLDPPVQNALVFSRTKHGADRIARELVREGIPAAAIHGNKSQSARVAALEGFKAGKTRVLVATDIAARGIDISELSHVFNYDLPEVPETYVHRIGRTARAGADGTAVSFCAPEEQEYLAGIEKLNRKKIPVVSGHPWDNAPARQGAEPAAAPVRTVRQQKKEETIMEEKEKRASRAAENGESRRGRRSRRDAGAEQQPARGGKAPRGGAQPKFDPHFLTVPESAPVPRSAGNTRPAAQPSQKAAAPAAAQGGQEANTAGNARGRNARRGSRGQAAASEPAPQSKAPAGGAAQAQEKPAARGQQPQKGAARPAPPQQKAAAPARDGQNSAATAGKQAPAAKERSRNAARGENRPARSEAPKAPLPRAGRSRSGSGSGDTGLVLISRRPPQQKFSSFEEYMAAHGGATAPIEDHSEE